MNSDKHKQSERERLEREYDELTDKERELDLEEERARKQANSDSSGEGLDEVQEETVEDEEENPSDESEDEEGSSESENEEKNDSEEEEEDSNNDEEKKDESKDNDSEEEKSSDSKEESKEPDKDGDSKQDESKNDNKVNSEERRKLHPDRKQDDKKTDDKKSDKDSGESLKDKAVNKAIDKAGNSELARKAVRAKELASQGVAAVKGFVSSIAFIGKMLINPIFWIVIGIILLVIAIMSTMSVIGGNDYNKLCDNNGISGVAIGNDVDDFTRQSAIASWLMSTPFEVTGGQPMSKEQAAAVVGNFIQEAYQANPKAMGGDNTTTLWQTCGNDCVLSWGQTGRAVGIAQWMGNRRVGLVEFAMSEGTEWHDLTTQLKYLKQELDSGYEMEQLINGGFNNPGQSVSDYTWIWQDKFERAGESKTDPAFLNRERYAEQFFAQFDGSGVSGGGGMVANCVGGGGSGVVDASSVANLAVSIAYTREEKAAGLGYGNCGGNPGCGLTFSKPEYVDAKKMVEEETGRDPIPNLLASCDRLVATFVRLTGMDPNFPYGNTGTQINYMNSNPGWSQVSCQNKQPGDVFGRSGHIMIYVGVIDGKETMVSASIGTRSAHMANISCAGDLFRGDNMSVPGWRKVN